MSREGGALTKACAIAVILLATQTAAAQPGKSKPAEAIFREGREAAAKGDMATACAKFEESVQLARAAGPLLNVAECEEQKGHLTLAAARWKEGIDLLEPSDDRLPFAKKRAEELDKRLPRITVRVTPEAADARVEIDGAAVAPADASKPQPVDPGDHKVVVTAGERTGRADVTVVEGDRREVAVTLSAALPPSTAKASSSGMRTAGFIAGGVGAAGLVVFGVTAGLMASDSAAVSANCDAKKMCNQAGLDASQSGQSLSPVNAVGLIVGIAGVGLGVTLILLSPSASASPVALRVTAGPNVGSASFTGAF